MTTPPRLTIGALSLLALIIAVWSSALFEKGLPVFEERLGVSLFVIFGGLLVLAGAVAALGGFLRPSSYAFFYRNRALLGLFALYWWISWLGILYSPARDAALLDCAQYFWYTALAVISVLVLSRIPMPWRRMTLAVMGAATFVILSAFIAWTLMTGRSVSEAVAHGQFSLSPFRDYNVMIFGMLMAVLLIFLAGRPVTVEKSAWKFAALLVLVAAIALVGVVSGSRRVTLLYGPIVALTPLVLGLARGRLKVAPAQLAGLAMAVALSGAGLMLLSRINVFSRLSLAALLRVEKRSGGALGFFTGEYADTASRTDRWLAAIEIYERYSPAEFLVGRGTRSFVVEPEFIRADGSLDWPHNFALSALLEGGMLKFIVLALFIMVWLHAFLSVKECDFWLANLLIGASLLWLVSVTISGEEFFQSKQFMLLLVAYAALGRHAPGRDPVQAAQPAEDH